MRLSQEVARQLNLSDIVLNLNYDTVFEMALNQIKLPFKYSPIKPKNDDILVCKPHGSVNMAVDSTHFQFSDPEWWGIPEVSNTKKSYMGFVAPRFSMSYDQNHISKMILAPLRDRIPETLTFWGIGLASSDADLLALFRAWARRAKRVEVINPDLAIKTIFEDKLNCLVHHYTDSINWENSIM